MNINDDNSFYIKKKKKNQFLKSFLTLWGTRKFQFFSAEILPEFKNRFMFKIVNAICKKIMKVKLSFKISGINLSSWESWIGVAGLTTQVLHTSIPTNFVLLLNLNDTTNILPILKVIFYSFLNSG